jgi:hypothetical protein
VSVLGDHAFVADPTGHVVVVDVSDPEAPRIASSLGFLDEDQPVGIEAVGGRAFVAAGLGGLSLVDISDAQAPREAGRLGGLGRAAGVCAADDDAFVINGEGLYAIDVRDASAPVASGYALVPGSSRNAHAAADRVWVAALDGGLVAVRREPR